MEKAYKYIQVPINDMVTNAYFYKDTSETKQLKAKNNSSRN